MPMMRRNRGPYVTLNSLSVNVGFFFKDGPPPSCTCVGFKSSLIPCRHITAVMVRLNLKLFTEDSIADRWKLNRHPLFELALEQLGISTPTTIATTVAPSPQR